MAQDIAVLLAKIIELAESEGLSWEAATAQVVAEEKGRVPSYRELRDAAQRKTDNAVHEHQGNITIP